MLSQETGYRVLIVVNEYQFIAIFPFISFKEEIIRLDEFLIFADSKIGEVTELSKNGREELHNFALNQKNFIKNTYKNNENRVTFVFPTDSKVIRKKLENFLEVLFFCLHKGDKFTYFFSAPNTFCREDFKSFIFQIPTVNNFGQFFVKKRFKFQIANRLSEFIISPSGCENIVTQNESQGYVFKDIGFNHKDEIFQFVYKNLGNPTNQSLIRGISFYNKAMSCELRDEERFVWLSSALESLLQIEKQDDKSAIIKQEIEKIILEKSFVALNKNEIIGNVADLITIIYDYRSSYVHGGEKLTKSLELEKKLKEKLGNLDFVLALMNLTSFLLVHDVIPDKKLEGILNVLFYNQDSFKSVIKIYQDSADKAIAELQQPENILAVQKFLTLADLQSISFEKNQVERCLNNILFISAKFADQNQDSHLAKQIQQQINNIPFKDQDKFQRWNSFFAEEKPDFTYAPDWLYFSSLVFQTFYQLLQYELTLF